MGAEDPTLPTTNLHARSDVAGAVVLAGSAGLLRLLEVRDGRSRLASHESGAPPRLAPLLILHGSRDETVPVADAEWLRDACMTHGLPHEFHCLEGADHCFAFWRENHEANVTWGMLREYLEGQL